MAAWLRNLCLAASAVLMTPAQAQVQPTASLAGPVGLIDMPSGDMPADATFSLSTSHFGPLSRNTLSFQITPRLSASFRYTATRNWDRVMSSNYETYFDRSFDLRYKLVNEGKHLPAVVLGINDIAGTGQWASEYIAATKTLSPKVKVTAGLGWGRLGSFGAIGAPFGLRQSVNIGQGGTFRLADLFGGDVAPFAGVEWQATNRLGLKLEYSSDAYTLESDDRQVFDHKSPFNFGVEYQLSRSARLGAYYLYGSQFGIAAHFALNPQSSPTGGLLGNAPPLVRDRSTLGARSGQWLSDPTASAALPAAVSKALATQGMTLESLTPGATRVEVRVRMNPTDNAAQAVGRVARVLTATMPASVEQFDILPVSNGMALSKVVINRRDMETLKDSFKADAALRARSQILPGTAEPADALRIAGVYPKLTYGVEPYFRASVFDPDNPLRADLGLRLSGRYEFGPGLVLSGSVTQKLIGNLDGSTRPSDSVLQRVRSEANLYDKSSGPVIEHLTLAWYAKPREDVYTRVTAGYLERMFGGVSAEVLWKPVNSRLGLGAEVNYVKQRDFDVGLGFQDYGVATGHVSAYYTFKSGFTAQLDVGRYLAGDLGATLTIDREFANGWRVGAFATLTDVPFEDFGEGSFDKGIRVSIPFSWFTGQPSTKSQTTVLRPVLRDGGARLDVDGRLYETVRSKDAIRLDQQWGSFWR